MSLIELREVSKSYGNKSLFQNLSIQFDPGTIHLLVGQNGSGKTTLLKLCMNRIQSDRGEIIHRKSLKCRYMPDLVELPYADRPYTFIAWMLSIMRVPMDLGFLAELDIDMSSEVANLSKGNKQKVLLYLSLVGQPDVVFMDEPFTALDSKTMKVVLKRIATLQSLGTCLIISTHEPKLFSKLVVTTHALD
ncbi:ATP-binding cassette domain-containing protein [Paracholeplasma manati]|uniref:ATP-binding cassette domain-containing protein n=1 Tax=Paracholeplasma manati TaxID=591373 RepID=A0ABT2Y6Y9_9MOLU|nr:ATP-binding cassette domain-containing protein [Paracholeplasma manati]MCV2232247.1 ATP-binding cassette domain-containing protein [Paracholeplasma manati]MDG0888204.1 ATP-binding cassette domain-containing protein [Paracholeplasma manati]